MTGAVENPDPALDPSPAIGQFPRTKADACYAGSRDGPSGLSPDTDDTGTEHVRPDTAPGALTQAVRRWRRITCEYGKSDQHFAAEPATEREAFQWMWLRWARMFDDPGNDLKRGQFWIDSDSELARRLNDGAPDGPDGPAWTKDRARSFRKRMIAAERITCERVGARWLVSVVRFGDYQPPPETLTRGKRAADAGRTRNNNDATAGYEPPDAGRTRPERGADAHIETGLVETRRGETHPPSIRPPTQPLESDGLDQEGTEGSSDTRPAAPRQRGDLIDRLLILTDLQYFAACRSVMATDGVVELRTSDEMAAMVIGKNYAELAAGVAGRLADEEIAVRVIWEGPGGDVEHGRYPEPTEARADAGD